MARKKPKGWVGESEKHGLAARGIRTKVLEQTRKGIRRGMLDEGSLYEGVSDIANEYFKDVLKQTGGDLEAADVIFNDIIYDVVTRVEKQAAS